MPKLTAEEKKQRKAERKLQKKLAAEAKKKQLRRDHLQRETEHVELNLKTLKKKWRNILLKVRLPEFKQDVETMWHKFDRALDLKNYIISCLLDEIDQDEQQYSTNFGAHVEAIDKLLVMFASRWDELYAWYRREVADLRSTARESTAHIAQQFQDDTTHVKTMMYGAQNSQLDWDYTNKPIIAAKTTEETNRFGEILQALRGNLERILEDLWMQFKQVLINYQTSTELVRKLYIELNAKDGQGGGLVNRQMKRTHMLYNVIRTLKDRLQAERTHQDQLLEDYLFERKYYADTYMKLKARLQEEKEHDHNQLVTLTVTSNEVMKHLHAVATKGEHVLKFAAICRKLETQEEKITPFPTPFLNEKEEEHIDHQYTTSSNMMLKVMDDFRNLDNFWRRVGEADLKRVQLRQCRDEALLENQNLRRALKQVMSGLAVGNDSDSDISVLSLLQQPQKNRKSF